MIRFNAILHSMYIYIIKHHCLHRSAALHRNLRATSSPWV